MAALAMCFMVMLSVAAVAVIFGFWFLVDDSPKPEKEVRRW
jgi:hypothetical protein